MAFWGDEKIKDEVETIISYEDNPKAKPANLKDRVRDAAIELTLGPEAYRSGSEEKVFLEEAGIFTIAPGDIAVLLTEEYITMPSQTMGLISLKSSIKIQGGLINVSGFHVDPGFEGRLVFTVYNAGTRTVAFSRGQRMFLIWIVNLENHDDKPNSQKDHSRHEMKSIRGKDLSNFTGETASPAKLEERINKLEIKGQLIWALLLALIVAVVTLFITNSVSASEDATNVSSQPQNPMLDAGYDLRIKEPIGGDIVEERS